MEGCRQCRVIYEGKLISLRNNGDELPAGAFLISPHIDLVNLDVWTVKLTIAADR